MINSIRPLRFISLSIALLSTCRMHSMEQQSTFEQACPRGFCCWQSEGEKAANHANALIALTNPALADGADTAICDNALKRWISTCTYCCPCDVFSHYNNLQKPFETICPQGFCYWKAAEERDANACNNEMRNMRIQNLMLTENANTNDRLHIFKRWISTCAWICCCPCMATCALNK